mgnify:CR=1 FL=1
MNFQKKKNFQFWTEMILKSNQLLQNFTEWNVLNSKMWEV